MFGLGSLVGFLVLCMVLVGWESAARYVLYALNLKVLWKFYVLNLIKICIVVIADCLGNEITLSWKYDFITKWFYLLTLTMKKKVLSDFCCNDISFLFTFKSILLDAGILSDVELSLICSQ